MHTEGNEHQPIRFKDVTELIETVMERLDDEPDCLMKYEEILKCGLTVSELERIFLDDEVWKEVKLTLVTNIDYLKLLILALNSRTREIRLFQSKKRSRNYHSN